MRIEANLFEVKEKQVLPSATYNGLLAAPKMEKSKNGNDMLVFKVKILDPVGPDYWDTLTHYITKQEGIGWANFGMKQLADAAGLNYDPAGFDTDDFANKQVRVIVEQTIYQDKLQNKIASFLKPI